MRCHVCLQVGAKSTADGGVPSCRRSDCPYPSLIAELQLAADPSRGEQRTQEAALRYDANKLRYDLLPDDSLVSLVEVYTKALTKYPERNWEKGMSWSRIFGSLMRHSWAFWRGERLDPETGCHHMAMAAWNCLALCSYSLRDVGTDDRPTTNEAAK